MKLKIIKDDSAVGLGSTVLRVLHNLVYRQDDDLLYFEMNNGLYSNSANTWNKFFYQPFNSEKEQIKKKFKEGDYTVETCWYKCGEFQLGYGKHQDKNQFLNKEFIEPLRSLVKKYLHIKTEITDISNDFIKKNNLKNVLSIHKRGTDHFVSGGHAAGQQHLMDYRSIIKPAVERALVKHKCDKIFLATDEEEMYMNFKKDFGDILLKYDTDLAPLGSSTGLHYSNIQNDESKKIKLGIDMLVDMLIMASCKYSLCMKSNVTILNILFRDNYNYEFIDDHIDYGMAG